jgi:hypothetical protein
MKETRISGYSSLKGAIAECDFEKEEVQILCDALRDNFNIRAKPAKDKQFWRIYVYAESSAVLKNLILPHMHQSFLYKLFVKD